jgi:hypothetical protein
MTASGKRKLLDKESKMHPAEVLPRELGMPSGVTDLIYDICDAADVVDGTNNLVWFNHDNTVLTTFFGISALHKKILALAEFAGPFDQLEDYISQAKAKNEMHRLRDTLLQAISVASIGSDFTIRDQQGNEIDKGMVEELIDWYVALFPVDKARALEQVYVATVLPKDKYVAVLENIVVLQQAQQTGMVDDEKSEDKTQRETQNGIALSDLSDAFSQNNEETLQKAIETFKTFVNKQQESLINHPDLYYANLIDLINGIKQLPNQWNGENADRFYGEILSVLRESVNRAVIKQVFDVFITGDKTKINDAIEKFKQFDEKNKLYSTNEQGNFINNLCNINQLHLISMAFREFGQRGGALPGGWYGEIADDFCIKIIGGLQCGLPARIRQTLHYDFKDRYGYIATHGLYHVLDENEKASRGIDRSGERYLGAHGSNRVLGVDVFYDIFGWRGDSTGLAGLAAVLFQNLLRAITSASKLYYTAIPVCESHAALVLGNVETSSSPATKRQRR